MRVLHVMGRFAASGTERQLAGMLLAAASGGHWEPTLCVLRAGDAYAEEMRGAGIPVVEMSGWDADPRRLAALRGLARHDFDVVHSSLYGANLLTRLALAGPGRPPVVISERRVEDWRPAPARLLDHALRPLADEFIGNSADVGDFIRRAHGAPADRVHVIRNGIDGSVFHPAPEAERASRPAGPLRIGSVGRLVPVKGYDVLVEAVRLLDGTLSADWVVVGEGPERARLERQAETLPVRFVGEVRDPRDVAEFLRTLDVFVLPSRAEGLPNVVLEAAACGVPVVATEAPGLSDAAAGAVLVPPDDAAALADA
ncbi:MAG: glycosyltransferase, partial [Actinomycetota bacterium]|nr:glycosyltransferase [Actinomycetota bacterium]